MEPLSDSGDALSELARQRRAEVERESTRPKPVFLQAVEQSEVIYTFELAGMPFRQIDLQLLSLELEKAYGVQLDGPDLSPLLAVMSREELVSTEESILYKRLMRLPDPGRLKWDDGRFPLRDDFIAIRNIVLTFESVYVSVSGVSEVAEVIAQETMELVWRLAGSKKSFKNDLEPLIQLTAYGTATRLQLGYGPEVLLNPALLSFLDDNLAKGKKYAATMGRQKTAMYGDEFVSDVQAVASLDNLTLKVNRFNLASGYFEDSEIEFDVTGRSDYRTGRIRVTSQLAYEKHIQLLSELFASITPKVS